MNCVKCGEVIPEGRLKALPQTKVCVACSGTRMKRAVTVTKGEGDHTWNDIVIMDAAEYESQFGPDQYSVDFGDSDDA